MKMNKESNNNQKYRSSNIIRLIILWSVTFFLLIMIDEFLPQNSQVALTFILGWVSCVVCVDILRR